MKRSRIIGSTGVALAALVASTLYLSHPALSSDHQDTFNLATNVLHNSTADITDVFVFPSPSNPANVVLAMDTAPLTPAGMGTSIQFDPTLLYQFKISHSSSGVEDQVIQFTASGTGTGQTINVYGPAKPNEATTTNTLIAQTASVPYNSTTGSAVTINGSPAFVFAGPRSDPFAFDLLGFFTFLGDKNFGTHASQSDVGPAANGPLYNGNNQGTPSTIAPSYDKTASRATMPTFNGFASGTMSNSSLPSGSKSPLGNYACGTNAASNTLADFAGGFNVESIIIEVPKTLLETNGTSTIHVWATVSSNQASS